MSRFPPHSRRTLRSFDEEEVGVSDVVGSILMVGITVVMATGLGFLILAFKGPAAIANVNLSITLDPGQFGWGTGDESIKVAHLGGDALPRDSSRITYTVNGVATTLTGANLGSAFADGKLTVGEVWVRAQPLASTDAVSVNVVAGGGQASLVAATQLVPSTVGSGPNCILDNAPPTAAAWLLSQPDVRTTTTGPIDVTVTLTDLCKGVAATAPELWYRIWDGVSATPYTKVTTAITHPGSDPNQWKGTIPSGLDFAHSGGKVFQYQFQQVSDGTNVGTVQSPLPDDVIDVVTNFVYMACPFTAVTGTVTNCPGAANNVVTDLATIQESTTSTGSLSGVILTGSTTGASSGIANGIGCTTGAACAASATADGVYAKLDGSTDVLQVGGFTAPQYATGITAISIGMDARRASVASQNTNVRLTYTGGLNLGTSQIYTLPSSGAATNNELVLPGSWSVANLANLFVQVDSSGVGSNTINGGTRQAEVDRLYVKITYTYNQYTLAATAGFTGAPLTDGVGGSRILTASGSVNGLVGFDSVNLQVCNNYPTCGSTDWVTKMTFSTSTLTAYQSASLVNSEWNNGSPKVRLIDATPTGVNSMVQTTVTIDYIRMNLS